MIFLYVNSVQFTFVMLGQCVGLASATSCLIFWKLRENLLKQGSIFVKHTACTMICLLLIVACLLLLDDMIFKAFGIKTAAAEITQQYFSIGIMSLLAQGIYTLFDGVLLAQERQKYGLTIIIALVVLNITFDQFIALLCFRHYLSVSTAFLLMGLSTTLLLVLGSLLSFSIIVRNIHCWEALKFTEVRSVLFSEFGLSLVRGLTPIIYSYQLSMVVSKLSLLTTYQLILNLSYVFCLPLVGGVRLAVREASSEVFEYRKSGPLKNNWRSLFFYLSFLPTMLALLLMPTTYDMLLRFFYNFILPRDHAIFVVLFFSTCLLGQIGNTYGIWLRAWKQSKSITKNFFVAEILVLLLGTQLLISYHLLSPSTAGYLSLFYGMTYMILNMRSYYSRPEKTAMGAESS